MSDQTTPTVIYDMDGVLVNSEPLWQKAEILSFAKVDIHLTEEMCMRTMGLRVDEVARYWFTRFPSDQARAKEIENLILENVISFVRLEGCAMNGVYDSLDFFKKHNLKLALASSSSMRLIEATLDKLEIRHYFSAVHSAEFEEYGKPHPGVYLTTAKKMGVQPNSCIAIEDSINGMIAAKAAKMKCIAIPDPSLNDDKRLGIADIVISSLGEIDQNLLVGICN
jgi:sugar-phosphatase